MIRRLLLPAFLMLLLAAGALRADPQVDRLAEALALDRLVEIMREEGLRYGRDLEDELFPGSGGARWAATVRRIHDPARMESMLRDRLAQELRGREAPLGVILGFLTTDPGAALIALELTAREALLDEGVKDAAEVAHEDMAARADPRLDQLRRFVEANDLIESNVAGALNSNLAFYRGMIEGGAVKPELSESEMLADLWSQEPQIRLDTEQWLYPYLALAYQPASDADLDAYVDFSLTSEGRLLNRALFAAFDAMFAMLSFDLGYAAAVFLEGEDI